MNDNKNNKSLHPCIDPFSPREGQRLEWRNLNLSTKKKGPSNQILKNISGVAKPGDLTCIMGPSGSGKTSLLQTLGGRSSSSQYKVQGDFSLDGQTIDPTSQTLQKKVGYIGQYDKLLATTTPRESIRFAARLRLPRDTTDQEIDALADKILRELNLNEVADHLIGGDLFKGLSGGEMRRVSLGVQLVVVPKMLFLDEITSGLDSLNAGVVMEICKKVASAGTTMMVVIHQPSSNIFAMIDHLILMDHGRAMYQGRADLATDHFAQRGYPMPENYNPADWLLQVPLKESEEQLQKSGFFHYDASEENALTETVSNDDPESAVGDTSKKTIESHCDNDKKPGATIWTQIREQFMRDMTTLIRDKNAFIGRYFALAVMSSLTAISFTFVGEDSLENPITFSSHVGAIFYMILGSTVIMQLVLFDFVEVRDLYLRELRVHQYGVLSFAIAKVCMELVNLFLQNLVVTLIVWWSLELQGRFWFFLLATFAVGMANAALAFLLGSIPNDPRHAREFIVLLILPQLLFSGFYVAPQELPVWIGWMSYLMPTLYAFRLVLSDEFSSCMDFEGMDKNKIRCLESASNAISYAFGEGGGLSSLYSDESSYVLAEVGTFEGREATIEYQAFVDSEVSPTTFFHDKCTVDGSLSVWHKSSSPDRCELMFVTTEQVNINPDYATGEGKEMPVANVLQGLKIEFEPDDDLQGITVRQNSLYYPQSLFSSLIGEHQDSHGHAESICEVLEENCPSSWEKNGFQDRADCVETMGALPVSRLNDRGQYVLDSNSTGCRIVHATLARENDSHCPHISYIPEADGEGNLICHDSFDLNADDLFDDEDRAIFALTAIENGLNNTRQVRSVYDDPSFGSLSDRQQCQENEGIEGSLRNLELPTNYFCSQYLQSQGATGDYNAVYWGILVGLYVLIRTLSICVLSSKARTFKKAR